MRPPAGPEKESDRLAGGGNDLGGLGVEARRFSPAIIDQALVSLTSFIAAALVARYLGAIGLGVFTVGTATLYGVGSLVNSLVLEPAGVIGPRDHDDEMPGYAGGLLVATVLLGGVAAVGGLLLVQHGAADVARTVGLGLLVAPPVFAGWATRRIAYIAERQGVALAGTFVYSAVVISSLLLLEGSGRMTAGLAIASLGVGGAIQAFVMTYLLRLDFSWVNRKGGKWPTVRNHWKFGRWLLAGEGSAWIVNYGLAAVSALFISLAAAGAFRAGQVLLRPYGVLFVGISVAYIPIVTRVLGEHETDGMHRYVRVIGWALTFVSVAFAAVLTVTGDRIMGLAFGPEFVQYGWLAAGLSIGSIPHAWISAYTIGLKAMDQPRDAFISQAAGAIVALALSALLGPIIGLVGFVMAFVLANSVRWYVAWRQYRAAVEQLVES